MKVITPKEAMELFQKGKTVQYEIARNKATIRSESELENLIRLNDMKVQSCVFFKVSEVPLPKNAMEISIDEALKLVADGESIYGIENEGSKVKIKTSSELMEYCKRVTLHGKVRLYWDV